MREMLEQVKSAFHQSGYRKRRNSFYKKEDGFYKLVDFQRGAYGEYFFINVGLHPIGLPLLQANGLIIPDHPKAYECFLGRRVEEIVEEKKREVFKGLPWISADMVPHIVDAIPDIEAWLQKWGSFNTLLNCPFDEIPRMVSVAPLLRKKEFLMLKCYCAFQLGEIERAKELFDEYLSETVEKKKTIKTRGRASKTVEIVEPIVFNDVDNYLKSIFFGM